MSLDLKHIKICCSICLSLLRLDKTLNNDIESNRLCIDDMINSY